MHQDARATFALVPPFGMLSSPLHCLPFHHSPRPPLAVAVSVRRRNFLDSNAKSQGFMYRRGFYLLAELKLELGRMSRASPVPLETG